MIDTPCDFRALTIGSFVWNIQPDLLPGEYIELRSLHLATGACRRHWFTDSPSLAAQALRDDADGYDVFIGVHARNGRAGGNEAVRRAKVIPADIDSKQFADGWQGLYAAFLRFPLQPSVAVSSGGGLHLYWRMREPLSLDVPADQATYRHLGRRLAEAVSSSGSRPDTITDPARILRVPGTHNRKRAVPRPVKALWCYRDYGYTPAELDTILDRFSAPPSTPAPPPAAPARRTWAGAGVIADFNARFDALHCLLAHGARVDHRHGAAVYLTRPGKERGTSATWNYVPGRLVVFSSGWPPFEALRGYDAFALFTLLEHRGDRRRAYAAARVQGYGMSTHTGGPPPGGVLLPPSWRPGEPLPARGDRV